MATTILKTMGSLDYFIQIAVPSGKTVDCNRFVGSPNGFSALKINPHEIVGIFFVPSDVAMIAVPSGKTVDCNRFGGSPNGISPLKINPHEIVEKLNASKQIFS